MRELCEVEKHTTEPLPDFLNDIHLLACRCYGTNCTRNVTVTISVGQPNPNSASTMAVSQMVLSSFPASAFTSSILASSSSTLTSSGGLAGGFCYNHYLEFTPLLLVIVVKTCMGQSVCVPSLLKFVAGFGRSKFVPLLCVCV